MFDFSWTELILIGIVAMIFIGPKDFPKVVRWFTDMIKKCRKMAHEFHNQFDEMVQDPDLKAAKDQLIQLRHMNVKRVILDTIDQDGTLQRDFHAPLNPVKGGSVSGYEVFHQEGEKDLVSISGYVAQEDSVQEEVDFQMLDQKDPAPGFFPPVVARRLQVKRSAPPVPAMIPPHIAAYRE